MNRRSIGFLAAMVALCVLTACQPEDSSYLGAWKYSWTSSDSELRFYERVAALEAANAVGYEIKPGGGLVAGHSEYVGGDFPTMVYSQGYWDEVENGDLILHYTYREKVREIRMDLSHVGQDMLECREAVVVWDE